MGVIYMIYRTNDEELKAVLDETKEIRVMETLCLIVLMIFFLYYAATHNTEYGEHNPEVEMVLLAIVGLMFFCCTALEMLCIKSMMNVHNKRSEAAIRILRENFEGFEEDFENPYYWRDKEEGDPDEYVPDSTPDPKDPSIK